MELAYGALAMAVAVRGGQVSGVIFHTGEGSKGVHRGRVPGGVRAAGRLPVDAPGGLGAGQDVGFVLHLLVFCGVNSPGEAAASPFEEPGGRRGREYCPR